MECSQCEAAWLVQMRGITGCCCFIDDKHYLCIAWWLILNMKKRQWRKVSSGFPIQSTYWWLDLFSKNKLAFVAAIRVDSGSRCNIRINRQLATPSRRQVSAAVWPGGVHTRVNSGICLCGISIAQRGSFHLPEGAACLFSEYDSSPEVHHNPASLNASAADGV